MDMGRFNRDSRSGRPFDRNRGGFGRSSAPREMFDAICSNCGKSCKVPFNPTSGKPVYCSDCFEKMGNKSGNNRRDERPQKVDYSKQFNELSSKMDKIIELLTPKQEKLEMETESPVVIEEKVVKAPKVKKTKEVVEE